MQDVEGGMIACILRGRTTMRVIHDHRVTTDFIEDPTHRKVYRWILKHVGTYGVEPTMEELARAYPSYEVDDPGQPVEYFLDQLAQRRRTSLLAAAVEDVVDVMQDKDDPERTTKAESVLSAALKQSQVETAPIRLTNTVEGTLRLLERWKSGASPEGISYGFDALDHWTRGMRPGQFVVITGHPKSRKSWVLLYMALRGVQAHGYPSLFVSFEMSNDEQIERHTTLMAQVPYNEVLSGVVSPYHEKEIKRYLHVKEMLPEIHLVHDPYGYSTVSSLQSLVKEVSPAVLFIDGVYFMTDEETGQSGTSGDSKVLTNLSRSLKRLATQEQIAVVVTTQQLLSKTKGGVTSLYGIGYASAFAQDAHVVVGVEREIGSETMGALRLLANRSGSGTDNFVQVDWDMHTGLVTEMYGGAPSAGPAPAGGGSDDDEDEVAYGGEETA